MRRDTPHFPADILSADEFRKGLRYDNFRSQGTADWLIILTTAGAGRVDSGTTRLIARAHTVTLYQPGTPQHYGTEREARHWHLLWSHFQPRPHWIAWLNWPEVTKGLKKIELDDPAAYRHVRQALLDTVRLSRQPFRGSMELAMNALERALLWIHSVNDQRAIDERVRLAVDVLTERLQEPFSLDALARTCGLSVSRLAHLFREQMGMPPQHYLEDLRLQRAAQLLRSSEMRIGEISEETGYANAFYFSGRFRKKYGSSPSEYRHRK